MTGRVKLLLFDVDGVLTDGTLHYGPSGEEWKTFNVKDGVAVSLLKAHGIASGVLSGKRSLALERRCQDLGVDHVRLGQSDKLSGLADILSVANLRPSEVFYIGDDVIDLPLAGVVGCFFAPADAHPLVLAQADVVLDKKGGQGVARDVADQILCQSGMTLVEAYAPLLGAGTKNIVQ